MRVQVWRPTLYHAPGRWPTRDGCMPYHLVWVFWREWVREQARDALTTAEGVALGQRGEQVHWERAQRKVDGEPHG